MRLTIAVLVFVLFGSMGTDKHTVSETWTNPKDGMVFVPIPAGSMTLKIEGDTTTEGEHQEVNFEDFWMGSTEVTVAQFREFVEDTDYKTEAELAGNKWNWKAPGFVQGDDHPVVYISFKDAKEYVKWAGVDLPDEAEWLYACHANTETTYYWGNEMRPELFWHRENSMEGTHPVATSLPNQWGLYDMIGNVWEYCKNIGEGFELRGESWTRCISYKSRGGTISDQMVAGSISKILHVYNPNSTFSHYPWDDDRGFRCVRRKAKS